jgi:osmotically inducible lipoprotein OsmB
MSTYIGKKAAAVLLAIGMTGCAAPGYYGPNQAAGTLIGGGVGGVLGHQIGSGNGRTAATIGGAILGAGVGSAIGQSVDMGNRAYGPPGYYRYPSSYGYRPYGY